MYTPVIRTDVYLALCGLVILTRQTCQLFGIYGIQQFELRHREEQSLTTFGAKSIWGFLEEWFSNIFTPRTTKLTQDDRPSISQNFETNTRNTNIFDLRLKNITFLVMNIQIRANGVTLEKFRDLSGGENAIFPGKSSWGPAWPRSKKQLKTFISLAHSLYIIESWFVL